MPRPVPAALLAAVALVLVGQAVGQTSWGDAAAAPAAAVAAPGAAAAPAVPVVAANPNGCVLVFDLSSNQPALVGGTVTPDAGKPPVPLSTGGGVQVGGRLALQLATEKCPSSWNELNETGLTGAKIIPTEEPTLRVLPGKLTAKIGKDLATVSASNVTLSVASSAMPQPLPPTPASPGRAPAPPPNTWQGLLVTGTAGTADGSPPTAEGALFKGANGPVPVSYVPTPANPAPKANAAATFSFTGADSAVFMSLQKLNFTFRTDWSAGARKGPAVVWIATNLTSSTVLGCGKGGCGPNGRCSIPADAAKAGRRGPEPTCVCRCGFTGPACDEPDAAATKCPPFPSWPASLVPPTPPPALVAGSGAGGVLGSLSGVTAGGEPCTCAAGGGGLAALLASSTCEPGWSGVHCDACTSDSACAASTGDPAATCSNKLEYGEHTVSKAYVCDLSDTVVGALVDPRKGYWFNCSTTPVEWPGLLDKKGKPRTGGSCELGIGLSTDPDNPIVCTAQACQFVPGSAAVQCPSTSCACPQGPPGADGVPACPTIAAQYVSLIDGKPVDATCTAAGQCTLNVKDFPIKLTAKCTAGDCQSDAAPVLKGGVLEQPRDYSSVIAAIPIMALVALAGVAGVQMLAATGRLGAGGAGGGATAKSLGPGVGAGAATAAATSGVLAAAAATKPVARAPAHPIRELKWWDLSCTVPATRFAPNHGAAVGPDGLTLSSRPTPAGGLGALVSSAAAVVSPTARRAGVPPGGPSAGLAHCTSTAAALAEAAARGGAPSPGSTPTAAAAAAASSSPSSSKTAGGWFAPRPRVHILRSAAGEARMGELVGVLGPSGCGKTTMLSILAGSVSSLSASSRVSGHITLDGERRRGWASRLVAYVPQNDYLLPTLTVAETIRYSALLRLPASTPPSEIAARVAATVDELGLTHVAGAQVGGSSGIRGVSGGERRRVTIGMELVIDPAIIVLDEPTSGLDSHTALNLMVTLKAVAAAGRIVMLSFHQPSPAMFDLLDRAFLMARGQVLYTGAPGGVGPWFADAGCPVPPGTAAAEHMLTAVSDPKLRDPLLAYAGAARRAAAELRHGGGGAPPAAGARRPSSLDDDFSDSDTGTPGVGRRATAPAPAGPLLTIESGRSADLEAGAAAAAAAPSPSAARGCRVKKPARTPFGRELAVLFWRTLTEIWRNPSLLAMHCIMAITMGLLCGGIFYNLKFDIAGAQGRLGAVFFALTLMALTSLTTVDLLTNERGLVVKEVLGGYYRPVSYYLSKATLDGLLLRILPAILFAIPLYPMSGFQPGAPQVALFFCVLAVFSASVGALSMAVTVGFGTAGRASLVMNLVLLLSLLFAGFLVNVSSITPALRWVASLSVFRYAFEAMTTNEMSGIELTFAAPTGPGSQPITVQGLPGGGGGPGGLSVDLKGDTFLQAIGLDSRKLLVDVLAIDLYWLAAVLLGVSLLYYTMPRALVVRAPEGEGGEGSGRGGKKGGGRSGDVSKASSFASLSGRLSGRK